MAVTNFSYMNNLLHDAESSMEQLRVPELKVVAKAIGLTVSGRKADIQDRIRSFLGNSLKTNPMDSLRPKVVKLMVLKARQGVASLPSYARLYTEIQYGRDPNRIIQLPAAVSRPSSSNVPVAASPTTSDSYLPAGEQVSRVFNPLQMSFKQSPFFKLKRLLNVTPKLAPKNYHSRSVCSINFTLNQEELQLLRQPDGKASEKYRLYLFSGVLGLNKTDCDIQFPFPVEIRVNTNLIKDNLRGIKNNPGTVKPADLSAFLNLSTSNNNVLNIIYACTSVDYVFYMYIVELANSEDMVKAVEKHPKIVKNATLQLMNKMLKEDDDDLITTSMILSLQCPISYCKMKYPARSIYCKHLQCFDALWFIESQRQVPSWQCPVCQLKISMKDLAICEFMSDIIQNTNDNVEQVEIELDGTWKVIKEEKDRDEDLSDGETKKVFGSTATSNKLSSPEPVVISLDSDDEDCK
ncbi:uncharacterized protein SCODWIG_03930 [Saccharomycodes ludwigii]|uniref:E3 SUMO-protein ligase SIZ2 n=1 Tax=Saccharomycodes ludwigii TaxID=36035 RepID=A0A376BBU6_9ASCO|nr:uncharacterized protein SCODWIG_03930 [Saccharomycodes ludwigii]